MHLFLNTIILFILFSTVLSCKKNNYKSVDFGYDYYGLTQGRFVEYKVTYIDHDSLLNKHDTLNFYLKTLIGDEYIDNEGRTAYEFLRYKKDSISGDYHFINKWVSLIADNKAQLVEENQRKVKLVFPVKKNQFWDVNMFNNLGEQEASYEVFNKPYSISTFNFDSTATVELYKYKTLIDDRLEQEVYAKGIGMIYKVSKELYYQFGISVPFKGTEWYYTIISTGIE